MTSCMAWRLAGVALVALGALPTDAAAQATFFEVPSADIPERAQFIGQAQLGVGSDVDMGATAVVGLGADTEVGVTFYNIEWQRKNGSLGFSPNSQDTRKPFAPLALLTAQKRIGDKRVQGSFGAQAGTNLAAAQHVALIARAYALLVLDLDERGRCVVGPYLASEAMLGNQQRAGAFMGCEIELIPKVFGFEAEWDVGAHALGKLSVGPRLHLGHWGALSVGAQVPNAWGNADYRALAQLEVTYPGAQE